MVDNDAHLSSLNGRVRALADMPSRAERVRALEDILGGMAERVRALEDILGGMDARVEQTAAQLRDEARAEVILRRALTAGIPSPRHAARPRRDRHGLHLVPAAAAAVAVCAARWWWHSHRAVLAGAALAVTRHMLGW